MRHVPGRNLVSNRTIWCLAMSTALNSCTSSVTVEVVPSNKKGACASSANGPDAYFD